MFLYKEGKRFGIVLLGVRERDKYTESDLELFSMLREPFTLALNNYLLTREVSKVESILSEADKMRNRGISVNDIIGHDFGLRNVMNQLRRQQNGTNHTDFQGLRRPGHPSYRHRNGHPKCPLARGSDRGDGTDAASRQLSMACRICVLPSLCKFD
ncbi:MAG: hypothetical protein GY866_07935 [Proteobacteria bacterium]|nr:hypothetical protein [Pseudomonadota bacterium]